MIVFVSGTGGPTPLSPAEVPAGGEELSVAIAPDGRHLYAAVLHASDAARSSQAAQVAFTVAP
jgi:hypothetical protein